MRDQFYRWLIVFSSFFVQFFVDGLIKSYGVIYVEIIEVYKNITYSQLSVIPALLSTLNLALAPVAAFLTEKYSCRLIVFFGGLLCVLGMTLSSLSTNIIHLYLTMGLITGLGAGLSTTPGIITIAKCFRTRSSLANGICVSGTALGSIVFPYAIKTLCDLYGFKLAVIFLGLGMSSICISGLLVKNLDFDNMNVPKQKMPNKSTKSTDPEIVFESERLTKSEDANLPTKEIVKKKVKKLDFKLFQESNFIRMVVSVLLMAIGCPYMLFFLPSHMLMLNFTKLDCNNILASGATCDLVGRLIFGYISDFNCINRKYFYSLSIFFCGLSVLCLPLLTSFYAILISICIYNLCLGIWFLLLPVVLTEFCGSDRISSSYGLLRLCQSVVVLCTLPINGWIRDITGTENACFLFMGTCMIIGSIPVATYTKIRNVESNVNE